MRPYPKPAAALQGTALFAQGGTIRREIRRWFVAEPKRWVSWLMLNPSVANGERSDQTAGRCTHYSRAWGYDGWIGVNLIPFVSSTQPEMWRWFDWESRGPDGYTSDNLRTNLNDIESAGRAASLRMVAYGAVPAQRCPGWLGLCLEAYRQPSNVGAGEALHCLGLTKDGQPLHPMARGKWRVPDDAQPVPFMEAAAP